jgi:hypothetical protein
MTDQHHRNPQSGKPSFKSDLYVFCFQCQTDPAKWDAQDLEQWEFYVMEKDDLMKLKVGKSISLAALRNFRQQFPCSTRTQDGSMSAAQFQSFMQDYTRRRNESSPGLRFSGRPLHPSDNIRTEAGLLACFRKGSSRLDTSFFQETNHQRWSGLFGQNFSRSY